MFTVPQNAQKVDVAGATVDFFKFMDGEINYYCFDTSDSEPPTPMVNAMAGLKLITDPCTKLIMINHKMPMGLFEKIEENYEITKEKLQDGKSKVVFGYLRGNSEKADLSKNSCSGH